MKLKGSIAVFAVAAAFSASAFAEINDCRLAIGYGSAYQNADSAWAALRATDPNAFSGGKRVADCQVPKKGKDVDRFGPMSADQCGLLNKMASADAKLGAVKIPDAWQALTDSQAKVQTLFDFNKLTGAAYAAIYPKVAAAAACVQGLQ